MELVATSFALIREQARNWLVRFPVPPETPPAVTAVAPAPKTDMSNNPRLANDPRYMELVARFDPAATWAAAFAKTGDESRADLAVAVRAVSLQLNDDQIIPMILTRMDAARRKKHSPAVRYVERTIAKARAIAGVPSPWIWVGGQFDPGRQFPWLGRGA